MNPFSRDAGIPVLTEIIAPSDEKIISEKSAVSPGEPAVPPLTAPIEEYNIESLEAELLSLWSEEEWNRLERKIRERILHRLLGRIDSVLEQQVRDHLADILQTAVEKLATDIKSGIHQRMEQVVTDAVSQELTRLQKRIK